MQRMMTLEASASDEEEEMPAGERVKVGQYYRTKCKRTQGVVSPHLRSEMVAHAWAMT